MLAYETGLLDERSDRTLRSWGRQGEEDGFLPPVHLQVLPKNPSSGREVPCIWCSLPGTGSGGKNPVGYWD